MLSFFGDLLPDIATTYPQISRKPEFYLTKNHKISCEEISLSLDIIDLLYLYWYFRGLIMFIIVL